MAGAAMDPEDYQRQEREAWDSVAGGWERWFEVFEAGAQGLNERLVELAGVEAGQLVLDVATGIGEPACTAARRTGPSGRVLAIDLAPQMLALGRQRVARLGLSNVELTELDAERLDGSHGAFDAAMCRWGLMLMLRPAAVARAVRGVLKPGARFAAAVWGTADEVPFIATPQRVTREVLGLPAPAPGEPGPLALGGPGQIEEVLAEAGFDRIEVEDVTVTLRFASPAEYVDFLGDMSSSLRTKLGELPPEQSEHLLASIAIAAAEFAVAGGIELRNRVICAVGARA